MDQIARIKRLRRKVEEALPRLLRRAEYVCTCAGLDEDPYALLSRAVCDLFEKEASDDVEPEAYIWNRIQQLAGNTVRDESRRRQIREENAEKFKPVPPDVGQRDPVEHSEDASVTVHALGLLQQLADDRGDEELAMLLVAMEDQYRVHGEYTPSALMADTGMDRNAYRAARARLTRMAKAGLPEPVVERIRILGLAEVL